MMTQIIKSIHKLEYQFDLTAQRFALRHPYIYFAAVLTGAPFFILAAVCISTTAIMLPVSWLCGWL